jgi:hypothetical protein
VDDEHIRIWELIVADEIRLMRPGDVNWPMIVISLIAEIKKLRTHNARASNDE